MLTSHGIYFSKRNNRHMLHTTNLKFEYPGGPSFTFPNIQCGKGEHLLILGESGKGKTTLLHLLAGMLQAQSGEVNIASQNISAMSGSVLDKYRGEHVGIVFQTAHFIESLSVEDNLIMPQYLTGKGIQRERASTLMSRFNLVNKLKEKPKQLSVGEQQRAAIARAVINNPTVILADEPTSALDDKNADEVIALLEQQAKDTGACLVIVTHDKRLKDKFSKQIVL
jgi:ABC-type lipoprotein export system ATPase subunit